jgi:hypothetical protein
MSRPPPSNTSAASYQRSYSFLETSIELQRTGIRRGRQAPIPSSSQSSQALTPITRPPLHDTHPAYYAPYADPADTQPQQAVQLATQLPQPQYQFPLGPLPVKVHTETQSEFQPDQAVSIEPDSNPLQSPRSPALSSNAFGFYDPSGSGANDPYPSHLPGQISHPDQEIEGGNWSAGLCDCTDIGTCCLGIWCPCILYGRTQYRLWRKSTKEDATNFLGYEACNTPCTAMAILCGCQCTKFSPMMFAVRSLS